MIFGPPAKFAKSHFRPKGMALYGLGRVEFFSLRFLAKNWSKPRKNPPIPRNLMVLDDPGCFPASPKIFDLPLPFTGGVEGRPFAPPPPVKGSGNLEKPTKIVQNRPKGGLRVLNQPETWSRCTFNAWLGPRDPSNQKKKPLGVGSRRSPPGFHDFPDSTTFHRGVSIVDLSQGGWSSQHIFVFCEAKKLSENGPRWSQNHPNGVYRYPHCSGKRKGATGNALLPRSGDRFFRCVVACQ